MVACQGLRIIQYPSQVETDTANPQPMEHMTSARDQGQVVEATTGRRPVRPVIYFPSLKIISNR